jgi:ubiquinone/menaquinone biosynthesis C-methylase UbiE/uncharacterized protein YbaR (Trm112 family)
MIGGLRPTDVALLVCPICRTTLHLEGTVVDGYVASGRLRCSTCPHDWPVEDGLAVLIDEGRLPLPDRAMRCVYDLIAPIHDYGTFVLLPLLQGSSEASTRDGHMRRLDLAALARSADGRPPRILEVGIGSGGNLPWVARDLPADLEVEIWGVDISRRMLAYCRQRLARDPGLAVRLLLADGHALPFPDASFDRVYNVGGIGGYGDPCRALTEMARVARPGTPIVVVDEQLDPRGDHTICQRLAFAALTAALPSVRCPTDDLPPGVVDVVEEQVSRFYYCLTFKLPAAAHGRRPSRARRPRT